MGAATASPRGTTLEGRRSLAAGLGAVLVLIGGAVFVGWAAHIEVLTSLAPGLVTMKPLTALAVVMVGVLLVLAVHWLRRTGIVAAVLAAACVALALAVVAAGGAALLQDLTNSDWGYENLFDLVPEDGTTFPARMAPATAVCMVLLGSGFIALLARRVPVAEWLSLLAMVLAYLAALVYAFGVSALDRISDFTSMAVHTSVAVILAGVGLLNLRPDLGFMRLTLDTSPGGAVVRRLLPVVVIAPTLAGLVGHLGVEQGWFGSRFALALVIVLLSAGGGALVWWQAKALAHTDYRRLDAEIALARVRRAEADRAQAMRRLEVANADLERFATIAAHDLRAPLTTIRGYAELLADQAEIAGDARSLDIVRRVERLVERGTDLITDLLAYSRSGPDSGSLGPVELTPLARQAAAEAVEAAGREATVSVGELGHVCGDVSQLRQVFQNLLGNAVKYCPPDREPMVVVDALPADDGRVTIRVTDNGYGIPGAEHERLFAIFERGSRTAGIAGSGVGLAICERIVGRHGGRIWVEDAPGEGARFCFTLEVAPDT